MDGSDAIADWPLLNAMLNTAAGASWVSLHHGGGVGIGYAIHAGQVIVADGTPEAAARLGLVRRRVLVAVSGGVDSTVLVHALRELSAPLGLDLALGHVNHGLRGAESDADEAFVEALARQLDLPFGRRRVAPEALRRGVPSSRRPSLQEAARAVAEKALELNRQKPGKHGFRG